MCTTSWESFKAIYRVYAYSSSRRIYSFGYNICRLETTQASSNILLFSLSQTPKPSYPPVVSFQQGYMLLMYFIFLLLHLLSDVQNKITCICGCNFVPHGGRKLWQCAHWRQYQLLSGCYSMVFKLHGNNDFLKEVTYTAHFSFLLKLIWGLLHMVLYHSPTSLCFFTIYCWLGWIRE